MTIDERIKLGAAIAAGICASGVVFKDQDALYDNPVDMADLIGRWSACIVSAVEDHVEKETMSFCVDMGLSPSELADSTSRFGVEYAERMKEIIAKYEADEKKRAEAKDKPEVNP